MSPFVVHMLCIHRHGDLGWPAKQHQSRPLKASESNRTDMTDFGSSALPVALETYGWLGRKSMPSVHFLASQVVVAQLSRAITMDQSLLRHCAAH